MKKILLFSLIACIGMFNTGAFADNCMGKTVNYHGSQRPWDNEFLYENQTQYDRSLAAYNNKGGARDRNSGDGHAYECDNSACPSGYKLTMKSGHVFEQKVVNKEVTYECVGSRKWQPITEEKKCITPWGEIPVGKMLEKTIPANECSKFDKTEPNIDLVEEWNVICRAGPKPYCKAAKCKKEYKLDLATGRCNKECQNCDPVDPKKECEKKGKVWNPKTQKCEDKKKPDPKPNFCDQYKQWSKRYACCIAGKATKWEGADKSDNGTCICVDKAKKWDGRKCVVAEDNSCEALYKGNDEAIACCNSSDATWNGDLKKCECNEENKNWKYDANTKKGQCVDIPRDNDEWSDCWFKLDVDITCKNSNNYYKRNEIRYLTKKEAQSIGCTGGQLFADVKIIDGIINDVKKADELINLVCGRSGGAFSPITTIPGGTPTVTPPAPSGMDIETAKSTLRRFFGEAKNNASVWKTEDGSFNTARLASDLTAGVVLGTVGGVVSANIIKKNQVKKGFEVLHCTIGGQTVADWGDQFNTSLRR